uniref:agamous-like MADS-box protein AGL16 n=1 Tax=Erigeron canadensis TaxID=72917 RepID=UPI001CB8F636|nr:agamous-like MADS-box protein AGL16 [Erigeron canadensis]
MGRAKLRMELITKERARNTAYQARKLGIIKKASEFSILCDVDTIIIMFPPDSNKPDIWPDNHNKIKKTIASYKSKKGETGRRTYDLHDFFEDHKRKIEDELVKARKKNMEAKYPMWFDKLDGLNTSELAQFAIWLQNKEDIVIARLDLLKRNMSINQQPFMFDNMQHMFHYAGFGSGSQPAGLDHGQVVNQYTTHDNGWLQDAAATPYLPLGSELTGQSSLEYEGGVVNGHNLNQWASPQLEVQGGRMPDFAMQELNKWASPQPVVHDSMVLDLVRQNFQSQVNNGGGQFSTMNDHQGRFQD